jgi:riboflavin kinase/FMN adenylyltransferase
MELRGRVIEGSRVGRALGYPTANVAVGADFDAADGVYAARVWVGEMEYGAMANLGVKPTFGNGTGRTLELHLFDFEGDLYGRELSARLVRFIRPERRFPTPEALRTQIAKDEELIRSILCI